MQAQHGGRAEGLGRLPLLRVIPAAALTLLLEAPQHQAGSGGRQAGSAPCSSATGPDLSLLGCAPHPSLPVLQQPQEQLPAGPGKKLALGFLCMDHAVPRTGARDKGAKHDKSSLLQSSQTHLLCNKDQWGKVEEWKLFTTKIWVTLSPTGEELGENLGRGTAPCWGICSALWNGLVQAVPRGGSLKALLLTCRSCCWCLCCPRRYVILSTGS